MRTRDPRGSSPLHTGIATRRLSVPSLAVLAAALLGILLAGCDLGTSPTRIDTDPRLDGVIDEADAGMSDAGPDATPDADAGDSGPSPSFECEPRCPEGSFCLPSGLCAELSDSCDAADILCDPSTVAATTSFLCEGVFENVAGLCRKVCQQGTPDACDEGEVCTRLYAESDIFICHDSCDEDDDCDALDTCAGNVPFRQCRGGCQPLASGQCPSGRACQPLSADRGFCQTAGDKERGESCDSEIDCAPGLFCLTTITGNICAPFCDPAVGGSSCPDTSDTCVELAQRDLGVCFASCDAFDPEQACEAPDTGCLLVDGRRGACVPRGNVGEGESCEAPDACEGNLQCITSGGEATCTRVCLRAASAGQEGSCPEEFNCAAIGPGEIGVCR